jgi:putative phage-type endonuclease
MENDDDEHDDIFFNIEAFICNYLTILLHSDAIVAFSKPGFELKIINNLCKIIESRYHSKSKSKKLDFFSFIQREVLNRLETSSIKRSWENSIIITVNDKKRIQEKMQNLRFISDNLPKQRSPEWYIYRHNLLTASNMYKVFGSAASQNSLIFEKCNPMKDFEGSSKSINTPMHWGVKYEPITIMIYEKKFNTLISDYGCIQHKEKKHIGASPDGVNSKEDNDRFGRMIEVKNTVTRKITGVPKEEYWVQMQIQMEVCDLDECDFIETQFYEIDKQLFIDEKEKIKGCIVHFMTDDGFPIYKYGSIIVPNSKDTDTESWIDQEKKKNESVIFIQVIYYHLHTWSCVLVQRNPVWFRHCANSIDKIWKIIEKERVEGYQHRAPKQKKYICHLPLPSIIMKKDKKEVELETETEV